jgi:chromosome segregation ATPase
LNELFADDSELMAGNEKIGALKKFLKESRKTIQSNMTDLRDFSRANKEIEALEAEMAKLRVESESAHNQVNDQKMVVDELQSEVTELRELLDSSKRWNEDANRIASKRMKISEKRYALGVNTQHHDRDLRTVESEVTRLSDEKDKISNRINELNKEMTMLNKNLHAQAEVVSDSLGVCKRTFPLVRPHIRAFVLGAGREYLEIGQGEGSCIPEAE